MKRILFICLGNICRSPAAHGVFEKLVEQNNLEKSFFIESAGTSAFHKGSPADSRMQQHAELRGYQLNSLSRPLSSQDFYDFDLLLTMDSSNYENTLALCPDSSLENKVIPFTKYCKIHNVSSVPDPYYGGASGFETVMDIIEDGCTQLLESLRT